MGAASSLESCFCGVPCAGAGALCADPPKNILTTRINPAFAADAACKAAHDAARVGNEFVAKYRATRAAGRLDEFAAQFAAAQFAAARAATPTDEDAAENAAVRADENAAADAAVRADENAAVHAAVHAADSAAKFAKFAADFDAARAAGRLAEFAAAHFAADAAAARAAGLFVFDAADFAAVRAAQPAAVPAAVPAVVPAVVPAAVRTAAVRTAAHAAVDAAEDAHCMVMQCERAAADAAAEPAAENAAAGVWSKPSITQTADCVLVCDTTCDFIGACETLGVQHKNGFLLDHTSGEQVLVHGEMPFIRFNFRPTTQPRRNSVVVTNYGRIVCLDEEGRWDCRTLAAFYSPRSYRAVERGTLKQIVRSFLVPFPANPDARNMQSYWLALDNVR